MRVAGRHMQGTSLNLDQVWNQRRSGGCKKISGRASSACEVVSQRMPALPAGLKGGL